MSHLIWHQSIAADLTEQSLGRAVHDTPLLRQARESRSRFFEQVLPKVMAASSVSEFERTPPGYDGVIPDTTFEELKKMTLPLFSTLGTWPGDWTVARDWRRHSKPARYTVPG